MIKSDNRALYILTIAIIFFAIVSSAMGLFYMDGGRPYNFVNQYGDTIKIYGDGIYTHDSYSKALISRGTDFTILFIAIPLLIASLVYDIKRKTLKSRMLLTSVISLFTYYSTSISFGVTYNKLHLIYIVLFSVSFFSLIIAMSSIDTKTVSKYVEGTFSYRGINILLILTGISLVVAWLPDIIGSLLSNRSLELIEVYTTEITYILDMGIISPVAFICFYLLKKKDGMGFVLLEMLLIVCILIGIMLPIQTIFQLQGGIQIPFPVLITKVGIFCLLAFYALFFEIRLFKSIKA
ncbi:hypothetical protein BACCIP111895_01653 [Neobacillus rhizosphaerae]|uniref:Uncharacterized protein n=1 Tax=Neobacillus rhizosphaerae TaxID=2880965 RepID=A0ABM9EPF0_9BACI|nr:hypothetical protein [Neobacillus rhizosphaerae]CAH2714490.1 hypothetical protein BACCIP111895_01653 [Neobacillus rhizosphaerae]